ncbi:MAG: STAS domain-containing protein [Planctomycetes bacterium]|nr:STAS domain-containing protein [Planctomycetota bacterium]
MPQSPAFGCRFEFTPDNGTVVIALSGKMDPEAVEELFPQIQEVFRAGVRRFVFDLSGLEYSGSLGLRLMVGLQNQVKPDGKVAVCAPNEAVRSMLEMTKLTRVLPSYPTREAALDVTGV